LTTQNTICCFGELLLRFSPEANGAWISNNSMPVYIGGAELNVATALAGWQVPVKYCTALPSHTLSRDILHSLQNKGIDTTGVHFSGNRTGVYYLPQGADLKNAGVIYDREGSSFASLRPGMLNWDAVLNGCSWFHFSAISPALNEDAAAVLKEGLNAAHTKGLFISVDLNYRAKLWQYGKSPAVIMPELVQYADMIMGNIWAAQQLLDIPSPIQDSKGHSREELMAAAAQSMLAIHQQYPRVQSIAYTFRLEETYFAILQHGAERVVSKEFPLINIVDKAGSGDCFMAGLIYGNYNQLPLQQCIDFAAAAATGKMKEKGDCTHQTIEAVKNIIATEWTVTK
jgi:2-dehydro-3-deoxygluconokinase